MSLKLGSIVIILLFLISSCKDKNTIDPSNKKASETEFVIIMQRHLDAVSNKNLTTLEGTLSPDGMMQLILPASEITNTVEDFLNYHHEWFAVDNGWTFETKILNTDIGKTHGMAVVEIIYREPERDGEPYFNRMIVSYDLKKIDGEWYIIKDHASSLEKSTDKK